MSTLIDIIRASTAVAASADAVTTGYPLPPEAAPTDQALPCVLPDFNGEIAGEFDWTASQDIRRHYWDLLIFVARTTDLPADLVAVAAVYEDVVAQFRTSSQLGMPGRVSACTPVRYVIEAMGFGGNNYVAIRLSLTAKEKTAVDFA
jgi:hypothetical protein